jgi:hypothetical protein
MIDQFQSIDPVNMESFNARISQANAAIDTRCRTALGDYTGDGTYGAEHKTTVSVEFVPKVLFVTCDERVEAGFAVVKNTARAKTVLNFDNAIVTIEWDDTSVRWYYTGTASANGGLYQLNENGYHYHYAVIG